MNLIKRLLVHGEQSKLGKDTLSDAILSQLLPEPTDADIGKTVAVFPDKSYGLAEPAGGSSNYNELQNRPQINSVTLSGNKSADDLGLVASEAGKGLSSNDYTDSAKQLLDRLASLINASNNGKFLGIQDAELAVADAVSADVPTSATIDNNGLISYKSSDDVVLFTLQLPLYTGTVST